MELLAAVIGGALIMLIGVEVGARIEARRNRKDEQPEKARFTNVKVSNPVEERLDRIESALRYMTSPAEREASLRAHVDEFVKEQQIDADKAAERIASEVAWPLARRRDSDEH